MHLQTELFKRFKHTLSIRKCNAFLLLASVIGVGVSCGKRKPPLPPTERVQQRVEIEGVQIGNEIRISWRMPARNASDSSTLNIRRADIYRLAETVSASLSLTEEEFAARSTLIGSVPITETDFGLKQKDFTDVLQFAGQQVRLRYAIRFVNSQGQKAAFSNFLLIEPTARVALPPASVSASVSQESITVAWTPPGANVDGTRPANILGYNIYRSGPDGKMQRLNAEDTQRGQEFRDEYFEFGQTYSYFVRTVSLGNNAEQLESLNSQVISVSPVDTFPPAAPAALTIAAAPNVISLFFAANIESDVAGYRVYRSTERERELKNWDLLTSSPLLITTFQDSSVSAGVTYFYYVTALDRYGNVSGPSEIVSDTAF